MVYAPNLVLQYYIYIFSVAILKSFTGLLILLIISYIVNLSVIYVAGKTLHKSGN